MAEIQAETFLAIVQEQLATKLDLKEVETRLVGQMKELELQIKGVESKTTQQIKELESKTIQQIKESELKTALELASIRRDIKELEMNTKSQLELVRRDLKIWFGGMLVTLVVVLSAVQPLMAHFSSH